MQDPLIDFLKLLKKSGFNPKSILDIGAHNGSLALQMNDIWPASQILMIEANKEHENSLQSVCCFSNVFSYKIALVGYSSADRVFYKTRINNNSYSTGNSMYREKTKYYSEDNVLEEAMRSIRLDDLCDTYFDLIKIDVQGAELEVILGGEITIRAAKSIICEVSVGEYNQGSPDKSKVCAALNDLGFQEVKVIDKIYHNDKEIQQNVLFLKKNLNPLVS